MAFNTSLFTTQLAAISGATEAEAIISWGAAFQAYFIEGATDNGVGFTGSSIVRAAHRSAMQAAMTGLSTSGADAIQAGMIGWWDYLASHGSVAFSGGSTVVKPTGLTSIAANMAPVMANNQANSLSAADACAAIVAVFHTANAGGTIVIGGSPRVIS